MPLFFILILADLINIIGRKIVIKMKYLGLLILFFAGALQAQNVKVVSNEQLTKLHDGEFVVSGVSPDGKKVLASSPGFKGLVMIDVNLKKITGITNDAGAGLEPSISPNGLNVFFRSDEFIGVKKYSSLSVYDISNGKTTIIESRKRELSPPVVFNNQLIYSAAGKQNQKLISPGNLKGTKDCVYVVLENLLPVLYINGIRTPVTPKGDGNYIWVSLSPDKSRLLFNYGGRGTFVSDLNGKITADLGRLNAPRWLNNEIVIGMNDKDDGSRILSSDIVCYFLNSGKMINLTLTSDRTEMYPLPFPDGKRLVYQTLAGELYVMTLKIN
jgi:Tol biopolymer transport system component